MHAQISAVVVELLDVLEGGEQCRNVTGEVVAQTLQDSSRHCGAMPEMRVAADSTRVLPPSSWYQVAASSGALPSATD